MQTLDTLFADHVRAVTGMHPAQMPGILLDTMRRDFYAGAAAGVVAKVSEDYNHAQELERLAPPARRSLFERIFGRGP